MRQQTLEEEIRYLREYAKKAISSPREDHRERAKSLRGKGEINKFKEERKILTR